MPNTHAVRAGFCDRVNEPTNTLLRAASCGRVARVFVRGGQVPVVDEAREAP